MNTPKPEETGVGDVRRAREAIARQHDGNLAGHAAESTRIAEELREKSPSRPGGPTTGPTKATFRSGG